MIAYSCLKYYKTAGQWNPGLLTKSERAKINIDKNPKPVSEIELDNQDMAILDKLSKNGRATYESIARASALSEATARRKTNNLLESGAVSIHGVINPSIIGFTTECWVWVRCNAADLALISEKIVENENVRYLVNITGDFQILFSVVLRDKRELSKYLDSVSSSLPKSVYFETNLMVKAFKRSGCKVKS